MKTFILFCTLLLSSSVASTAEPPPDCNIKPTQAVTQPALVNMDQLIQDLNALTTQSGQKMVDAEKLRGTLQKVFDTVHPSSKLQQFYRLLYVIAKNSLVDIGMTTDFNLATARRILVTARVFPDPIFPAHISRIQVVTTEGIPKYTVSFSDFTERFPLNQGEGFRSWDDGYCQHAKELVFAQQFTFKMKELKNGNLKVYGFQGVDLYGSFGTRGAVDVDLNFVRLAEVEFIKASNLGRVRAFISKKEFEKNQHNAVLKWISQVLPNTSLQAIDW